MEANVLSADQRQKILEKIRNESHVTPLEYTKRARLELKTMETPEHLDIDPKELTFVDLARMIAGKDLRDYMVNPEYYQTHKTNIHEYKEQTTPLMDIIEAAENDPKLTSLTFKELTTGEEYKAVIEKIRANNPELYQKIFNQFSEHCSRYAKAHRTDLQDLVTITKSNQPNSD
jgi:hypothetical protein